MLPVLEKLLVLQHGDRQVRDITLALEALPREKESCDRDAARATQRLDAAQERRRDLERELKRLDGDILTKNGQITRYKTQQLETRKNEEYTALLHEIALAKKVIAEIEEHQLQLMEQMEALTEDLETAQAAHDVELKRIGKILATLDGRRDNLLQRRNELLQQRPHLLEGIEEDLLDRYDRLFQSKEGSAIVPIEHNICMGCHMKVTTQTVLQARAEKEMVTCSQCGRILYNDEDELLLQPR
jgi:predicted  nucleic acid-binding Zn-ribbon protein